MIEFFGQMPLKIFEYSIPKERKDDLIENAQNGSIVVFHDSVKASGNMQYALPKVLEHFSKEGFAFEALG